MRQVGRITLLPNMPVVQMSHLPDVGANRRVRAPIHIPVTYDRPHQGRFITLYDKDYRLFNLWDLSLKECVWICSDINQS